MHESRSRPLPVIFLLFQVGLRRKVSLFTTRHDETMDFPIPFHRSAWTCMRNGIWRERKIKPNPWFGRAFHRYWLFLLEFICISCTCFVHFLLVFLCWFFFFFLRCMAFCFSLSVLAEPYECFILPSCHSLLKFLIFNSCLFSWGVFLRLSQWYIHIVQILFRLLSSQAPGAAGSGRAGRCGSGSALFCSF